MLYFIPNLLLLLLGVSQTFIHTLGLVYYVRLDYMCMSVSVCVLFCNI